MNDEDRDWREETRSLRDTLVRELGQPCRLERQLDGGDWFVAGEPPEVIVRLDDATLSVYRYEAGWNGPHEPYVRPVALVTVYWHEVEPFQAWMLCHPLVSDARAKRRASFGKCRYCKVTLGPEHMHSADVCQGCAERHLGVVH